METPDTDFDRTPYAALRESLTTTLIDPINAWMALPPARRTVPRYRQLLDIPLELAAAGCTVTTDQKETGWNLTIQAKGPYGARLSLHGQARRLSACLSQLANQAEPSLALFERQERKAWKRHQEVQAERDTMAAA